MYFESLEITSIFNSSDSIYVLLLTIGTLGLPSSPYEFLVSLNKLNDPGCKVYLMLSLQLTISSFAL